MTQAPAPANTSRTVSWTDVDPTAADRYRPLKERNWAQDSTLVIFDAQHAAYRAFHTRDLSAEDGTPTSSLHGVLSMVQAGCESANTRRFLLVWDGGLDYKRAIHRDYKARHDRTRTPEEEVMYQRMRSGLRVAKDGLAKLGFPQLTVSTLEADDAIGLLSSAISRKIEATGGKFPASKPIERVLLVTDDKDYYQLVDDRVLIWRGVSTKLIDRAAIVSQFGFGPELFPDYKALVGEPIDGDNIPGVDGFGDVTAQKYVSATGPIEKCIAFAEAQVKSNRKPRKTDLNLWRQREQARLSYRLSRIMRNWADITATAKAGDAAEIQRVSQDAIAYALKVDRPTTYADYLQFAGRYSFGQSFEPSRVAAALGFSMRVA